MKSGLIIKNDGLGDLVVASGTISRLASRYDEGVDILVRSACAAIAERIPGVNRVLTASHAPGFRGRGTPRLFVPKMERLDARVVVQLLSHEYDEAVCLRRFIRRSSFLFMRFVRAKRKLRMWQYPTNLDRPLAELWSRGWEDWSGDERTLSESSYYSEFCNRLTGSPSPDEQRLKEVPQRRRNPESREIGLIAGGWSSNWPYWVELAELITAHGYSVHIFGGSDVAELAQEIVGRVPNTVNHVGRLGLFDAVERVSNMRAAVGNDTGMSHLASLVLDPVMIVLGGGTFQRFFPWPEADNQYIIYHALDCYDCDWSCCHSERLCQTRIPPTAVAKYLNEVLTEPRTPRQRNLNAATVRYRVAWQRSSEPRSLRVLGPTLD